jgi:hypothetical protein
MVFPTFTVKSIADPGSLGGVSGHLDFVLSVVLTSFRSTEFLLCPQWREVQKQSKCKILMDFE